MLSLNYEPSPFFSFHFHFQTSPHPVDQADPGLNSVPQADLELRSYLSLLSGLHHSAQFQVELKEAEELGMVVVGLSP